ncbi:MAG TPA: GNAT family N-acetyltransferase [bacterium]|nr:GNAT family N-acetyltransferase [bacterium]
MIETGLAAAAVAYVRQGRGFVHEEPALTWVSTGAPIPFYSGVVRTRLRDADTDRIIDGVIAEFHARGWMMGWWAMPPSRPADLVARLTARGFTPWTGDLGMAVNLADVPATVPLPPDVTIERVRTMEALEDWLRAFGAGFGIPEAALAIYRRLPAGVPPAESVFRFYLARAAGVPVATSMWFPAPDAAVIDEIAAVPEMRRRGIGTAVTHAALRDAQMTGYRTAVLVASKAGEPVYRRLGFKAYGRREIYLNAPLPRYR